MIAELTISLVLCAVMFRGGVNISPAERGFTQNLPNTSDRTMDEIRRKCDSISRKKGDTFLIITRHDEYIVCMKHGGKWWFKVTDQSAVEDFPESKTVHWHAYIGRA